MTENCRTKTARLFGETFFAEPSALLFAFLSLLFGRRNARDKDLVTPKRGHRGVHAVGGTFAVDVLSAARPSEYAKVGIAAILNAHRASLNASDEP